ncbi:MULTISPECIES: Uma2 family endonuclease [Pseudanabaena]|jgi:Uma2 family endonuclease|uniref:Uma2 family endonuclease n=1 Tax=Pseudanabaena TaxID=1152 RepID=UPI002479AEC1|nr:MULTISPECIES: Uma2 family endonuclease [Pseudanabaena]MEA5488842.1 Uma2 family endonuclease [Pseudanabaena sp. CCNP1317]WGS74920.1 Uma2 family endonuclease [Pseudanabaena galeata CCNP1313]
MLQLDRQYLSNNLPDSDELPDSDDTPVDNEDQNYLPNLLLFLLEYIWKDRHDWYFGVDMGIYHTTGASPRVPIVPDGFLSVGVERRKAGKSRKSYVMWEENNIVPILTIEMVSHTYGDEYEKKLEIYRHLGVKYYLIYNPEFCRRDGHLPLEIYQLIDGDYQLQQLQNSKPFWMPEIGLGIGRCTLPTDPYQREVLTWFDQNGDRYLTSDERASQSQQQVEALQAKLRSLGIE